MLTVLFASLMACSGGAKDSGSSGDATAGATVFADNCAGCHGSDGKGGSGPDLSEIAAEGATGEIETYVRNGEGDMPAFEGTLDDTQIADVVAFVLTI